MNNEQNNPQNAAKTPTNLPVSPSPRLPVSPSSAAPIDPHVNTPQREGLTGTTAASVYKPLPGDDTITQPPDGRPMDEQPAWRQDFPIDWPQDHYVARRDFTKFLVLTSGAFVCGQLWIGGKSIARKTADAPAAKKIALLSELAVGQTKLFAYPNEHDACVLIRVEEDLLLAYSQKCTHLSCAVIPKPEEGIIHCPCHEGYFDLRTGRNIAGPPPRPLPKIKLEQRGDEVWAVGVELSTV